MAHNGYKRRGSIGGALIVIAVGIFFLVINLHPDLDAWSIIGRYWPVLLIAIGLGYIWDAWMDRTYSQADGPRHHTGAPVAVLVVLILLGFALWHGRNSRPVLHATQDVSLQGAQFVTTNLDIPSGSLEVAGGASQLLNANFDYHESDGAPRVEYSVSGGRGDLSITQENKLHVHLAIARNDWQLRFADNVPMDMNVQIGAGSSNLRLQGLSVKNLDVQAGVGQLNLDLTGPRKSDLHVDIHGGVGSASIRLPKDVGVRVHASGGIGSVSPHGLTREGDDYVNDVLGKTPATIDLTIEGGIGSVSLRTDQ
ncbi:MAG TPA: toast rack family protein [Candidatus Acidoferrales bacterium]